MNDRHSGGVWLMAFWLLALGSLIALHNINESLKKIADRIHEANMTYEEHCEYWPEECEELF